MALSPFHFLLYKERVWQWFHFIHQSKRWVTIHHKLTTLLSMAKVKRQLFLWMHEIWCKERHENSKLLGWDFVSPSILVKRETIIACDQLPLIQNLKYFNPYPWLYLFPSFVFSLFSKLLCLSLSTLAAASVLLEDLDQYCCPSHMKREDSERIQFKFQMKWKKATKASFKTTNLQSEIAFTDLKKAFVAN